jgi:hypothetical protein
MESPVIASCTSCKHHAMSHKEEPCYSCLGRDNTFLPHFEPKVTLKVIESSRSAPLKSPEVQPELDLGVSAVTAPAILQDAADILKERGKSRDKGEEERSMATVVNIFNAAEGMSLTEEQGWKFMLCLKLGRMKGGKFHFDDYQDLVGYSALLAECAATTQLQTKGNT